jgi:hypothetical protein
VEGDAELVCPLAANAGRPLPGTSALADRNIMHPFQVSLKRRKGKRPWLPSSFLILPVFVSIALVPGEHGHSCVTDRADLGKGGGGCRGASICS